MGFTQRIFWSKDGQFSQAYTRPEEIEHASEGPPVSDAPYNRRPSGYHSRRVVHLHRPQRRLLSRSQSPGTQKVSPLFFFSSHFYKIHEGSLDITVPDGRFSLILTTGFNICAPLLREVEQTTFRVLAHIEALGMYVNWEKSLSHPTQQTTIIAVFLDSFWPTMVCPPWGEFDCPDMAQADGDADSVLSNNTTRPAALCRGG